MSLFQRLSARLESRDRQKPAQLIYGKTAKISEAKTLPLGRTT